MSSKEFIYLYRRKGQDAWVTCDAVRYTEMSGNHFFEVRVARDQHDYAALEAENARLARDYQVARDAHDALLAQLAAIQGGMGEVEAERITVVSITGIIQAVAATDYDSLKAERDRLQKELADLHSARSAPAERVEVVGYAGLNQLELHRLLPKYPGMKIKKEPNERYTEPLMTVAQHERIVAAATLKLIEEQRIEIAKLMQMINQLRQKQ